jgi:hypothetical protein
MNKVKMKQNHKSLIRISQGQPCDEDKEKSRTSKGKLHESRIVKQDILVKDKDKHKETAWSSKRGKLPKKEVENKVVRRTCGKLSVVVAWGDDVI